MRRDNIKRIKDLVANLRVAPAPVKVEKKVEITPAPVVEVIPELEKIEVVEEILEKVEVKDVKKVLKKIVKVEE